jgi:hypothetical protein
LNDLYLKFADEQECLDVLYNQIATDWSEETGEPTEFGHKPKYRNINVIGTIYEPTGVMLTDDEGNEYSETQPMPGYHVNVRLVEDEPNIPEQYIVTPSTPKRVFF